MKKINIICLLSISILLTNCATIMSGSKQNIHFDSSPGAADIYIDEIAVGKTPFQIKLERKSEHHVMIKLDGYKTYETSLTRKFNAWYVGNILIGGIIGLIIDPITGAIYNLSPDQINAPLDQKTALNTVKSGDINIAVSLEKDPNYVKIGQLEKL